MPEQQCVPVMILSAFSFFQFFSCDRLGRFAVYGNEAGKTKAKEAMHMPADDADLIRMFEMRSEQAIAETQTRYGGFCYSIVYRILGNAEDAEECVSDAMLHLWNAIPPAKPKSFRAFLITLTKHIALDRQAQNTAVKRGGGSAETSLESLPDVLAAADDTALAAEQRMLREALGQFLSSLPQETRILFIEHYWMMCTVSELAEEHKMGKSAVKMTLLRTRKKLGEYLRKEGLM